MNTQPASPPGAIPQDDPARALASLLLRIQDKPGFPALSESVAAINEITSSDDQNIEQLSATILKDFGLSSNILRIANSVTYRAASGSGISSVTRAVSVLGFASLRDIAVTVVLFSQIKNRAGARELKEAFLRAHLAGTLAREAGRLFMPRHADEVYTCALLYSLGQILTLLYFPEEAQQIRELINQQGCPEDQAVRQVLGVDFSRLGMGVAEQWHFPATLVHSLQPLPEGVMGRPQTPVDTVWMLCGFGNEVCLSLAAQASQQPSESLPSLRQRFAAVMPLSNPQLHALVKKSFEDTQVFSSTLGISLTQSSFVKKVTEWVAADPADEAAPATPKPRVTATADAESAAAPAASAQSVADAAQQILSAGIGKLSNSMIGDFVLNDIFRMTLETIRQALDFQRVLLCMRDNSSGYMVARMGDGKDASLVARKFRFPLKDAPNVFQLAISNGVDIVIKDIADPKITDKIPAWYRQTVSARSFALMPLMLKGQAIGMIYCDKQQPNSIVISEKELGLLKTLRNQAVLAIKQSTAG